METQRQPGLRVSTPCHSSRGGPALSAVPLSLGDKLLEGEGLMGRLVPASCQDVKQVGLAGFAWPACQLQVMVAQRDRFSLLPLVEEHVDCGLAARDGNRRTELLVSFIQSLCSALNRF